MGGRESGRTPHAGADRSPDRPADPVARHPATGPSERARHTDRRLARPRPSQPPDAQAPSLGARSRAAPQLDDECAVPSPDDTESPFCPAAHSRGSSGLSEPGRRSLHSRARPDSPAWRWSRRSSAYPRSRWPRARISRSSLWPRRRLVPQARSPPPRRWSPSSAATRGSAWSSEPSRFAVALVSAVGFGFGDRLGIAPKARRGLDELRRGRITSRARGLRRPLGARRHRPARRGRGHPGPHPASSPGARSRRARSSGPRAWRPASPTSATARKAQAPRSRGDRRPGRSRANGRATRRGEPAKPRALASAQPALHGGG